VILIAGSPGGKPASMRAPKPPFMTVAQCAALLQTTPKAVYTRMARHQLAGVVRLGDGSVRSRGGGSGGLLRCIHRGFRGAESDAALGASAPVPVSAAVVEAVAVRAAEARPMFGGDEGGRH
jgi:hypothetical protein